MAKKMCELCQIELEKDIRFGVHLCKECLDGYNKAMTGDPIIGDKFSNPSNFPRATNLARTHIIDTVARRFNKITTAEAERQKKVEIEEQRQAFAKSFNEFYEYDVVTIINENHGCVDKGRMLQVLTDHAKQGWKLHTMYSNELGKNAISLMGLGVNSTACEDVLIFERRIEKL